MDEIGIRDSNKLRVLANGITLGEREKNVLKNTIINEFKQNPSYFQVYFNDSLDLTEVHIVDDSVNGVKINNSKIVVMKPSEKINIGDSIKWEDEYWICTSNELFNDIYYKGTISKCTNVLRFYDKTSVLNSIILVPCVVSSTTVTSLGIDNQDKFNLLEGKIVVQIPNNEKTSTIYEKQRFILGQYAYQVTGIDDITSLGILKINMKKVEKNEKDDFINGIAWNEEIVANNYKINILNGSSISFNTSQSILLNTQVTNNGTVITPIPELIYTSSDVAICEVNSSGNLTGRTVGNCVITVSLKSEPSISATINISVVAIESHNLVCNISGVDKIIKNKSAQFNCIFTDNNTVISKESLFYLTAEDGITPLSESIAIISSQDSVANKATVQTKTFSGIKYCMLFAKSSDGLIISNPLRIKIYSLI